MITGDFNARTGTLLDYINDDSTSYIPLYSFDKFYPRHSQIKTYGKKLIGLCIASKLRIVNGRLDSTGGFTCFTPRGNSVVDYLIVSESLFTIISHFEVGNPSMHSDHCPLLVNLKIILDSSYCPKSASTYLKTKNQFREKNENTIWNQRIKGYVSKSFRSFKFCKLLETLALLFKDFIR